MCIRFFKRIKDFNYIIIILRLVYIYIYSKHVNKKKIILFPFFCDKNVPFPVNGLLFSSVLEDGEAVDDALLAAEDSLGCSI
jgi:hypothetical protein